MIISLAFFRNRSTGHRGFRRKPCAESHASACCQSFVNHFTRSIDRYQMTSELQLQPRLQPSPDKNRKALSAQFRWAPSNSLLDGLYLISTPDAPEHLQSECPSHISLCTAYLLSCLIHSNPGESWDAAMQSISNPHLPVPSQKSDRNSCLESSRYDSVVTHQSGNFLDTVAPSTEPSPSTDLTAHHIPLNHDAHSFLTEDVTISFLVPYSG